jgi:hypothetical protein
VLLVAPGSTGRYFSWTLRPRAAAAVIGGLYVASAIVFAWALTASRRQARPLVVGILGLRMTQARRASIPGPARFLACSRSHS